MPKAITFDFWDTLVVDESDEPKRKAKGLLSKSETRFNQILKSIEGQKRQPTPQDVRRAVDLANRFFYEKWQENFQTPGVDARLKFVYEHLRIEPPAGFDQLVSEIQNLEVEIPPDLTPGVKEILPMLAKEFKLGIISDTIHTPGWGLRKILEDYGLIQYFSHWVFSDEAGASKPDPFVYKKAAEGLKEAAGDIVHVGDREKNDVAGPKDFGMRAILFTGARDRGDSHNTRADGICSKFEDLPEMIRNL